MAVSIVLDVIVVLIAIITVIISHKKGFVKALIDTVSFFLAIIIALILLNPVKSLIYQTMLDEKIFNTTETHLDKAVGDKDIGEVINETYENKETEPGSDENNHFSNFLENYGIDIGKIKAEYDKAINSGVDNAKHAIVEYIAKPIANAVITAVAFICLFIISLIVVRLISFILNIATKLPILNGINKFLSIPLGICLALLRIYCLCAIIKLILPYSSNLHLSALNSLAIDSTFIFRFFYDSNILINFFA